MAKFFVIASHTYIVEADTEEDAEQKYLDWLDSERCSCGLDDCECIEENEVTHEVTPC